MDEFAQRLFGELDYIQEGESCEKFAKLYAHVPRVRTPGIHWSATARRSAIGNPFAYCRLLLPFRPAFCGQTAAFQAFLLLAKLIPSRTACFGLLLGLGLGHMCHSKQVSLWLCPLFPAAFCCFSGLPSASSAAPLQDCLLC